MPNQAADCVAARYTPGDIAIADARNISHSDKPAHLRKPGYIHINQAYAPKIALARNAEQARNSCVRKPCAVDVQVEYDAAVAFEYSAKRLFRFYADGKPAAAARPIAVDCVGCVAYGVLEVQALRQFVAVATQETASHIRGGVGECGRVGVCVGCAVFGLIGFAVAVKVIAHCVQLLQVRYLDEAVVVLVIVYRRLSGCVGRAAKRGNDEDEQRCDEIRQYTAMEFQRAPGKRADATSIHWD